MKKLFIAVLSVLLPGIIHCDKTDNDTASLVNESPAMTITSPAFAAGDTIPIRHTCDGINVSPALVFNDVPDRAQSLVLICDDPDAPRGTWVHWVLYNLPPDIAGLPENFSARDWNTNIPDSMHGPVHQGMTDFGEVGYGGPCPPGGKPHRYFFKLYALDIMIAINQEKTDSGLSKADLLAIMNGHILEETSLLGMYGE